MSGGALGVGLAEVHVALVEEEVHYFATLLRVIFLQSILDRNLHYITIWSWEVKVPSWLNYFPTIFHGSGANAHVSVAYEAFADCQ